MQSTTTSYGRIAATTALILATLAAVWMLYRLDDVVIFAVLSIIFAAALRAPMLRLEPHVRGRSAAILLLYLVIFLVVGFGVYAFSFPLGNDVVTATSEFPRWYDAQVQAWQTSGVAWQQSVAESLPDVTDVVQTIGENGAAIAYELAGVTYNVFNILLWAIAVFTLTFYWLVDEDRFARLWLSLLPVQQRSVARQIWFDIEWRVGLFVRSESAQFIVTVALLWGGLRVAGVPSAALWALYGGIAQLIPWIGVPLIFVPLLPLALVVPWPVTFGAALVVTVVAWVIERGIEPWFGTRGIIHPIVSVLALMVLGEAAGLVGMMIALPLAATIQSVINNVLQVSITPRVLTPSATSMRVQALRTQLHDLEARLPTEPEQRRVQEGLLARTAALLDDADHTLRQHARTPERRRMTRSPTLRDRIPAIFSRDRQGR